MLILFTKHEDVGTDDAPYLNLEHVEDVPMNEGVVYYSFVTRRADGNMVDGDLAPEALKKTLNEFSELGNEYTMLYEHK